MTVGLSGKSSNEGYLAIGRETTAASGVTCTASLEFYSGTMRTNIESMKLDTISRSRGYTKRVLTVGSVEGSFDYPFVPNDLGALYLLQNALGGTITTSTISAASSFSHVFDIGNWDGTYKSLSLNQRLDDAAAHVFETYGTRTSEFKFSAEIGEVLKCSSSLVGKLQTNTTNSVADVITMSSQAPLVFHEGAFTFSNSSEIITKAELTINNNMISGNEMRQIGSKWLSDVTPAGKRDIMLSISMRFDTTTAYSRFINNEYGAVKLVFTGPTITGSATPYLLQIDLPKVYYKQAFPEIGGPSEILSMDIECDCIVDNPNTSTGYDVKFTVQNELAAI